MRMEQSETGGEDFCTYKPSYFLGCVSLAELKTEGVSLRQSKAGLHIVEQSRAEQTTEEQKGCLAGEGPGPRAVLQQCCFHSLAVSQLNYFALNSFLLYHTPNWGFLLVFELAPSIIC